MINISKPGAETSVNFDVKHRKGYGSIYLPTLKEFLLRTRNSDALIIDKKKLVSKAEFSGKEKSGEYPGHNYITNENDSEIITNSN